MKFVCFIAALLISSFNATAKPNIILIMCDDMGYSDLGCYGSEIDTPALDGLAENGLRFTQFYNTGRCCPTRASLISGLYPHQAGMGHMTGDRGPDHPGYRGRLMFRAVTIAEVLGAHGYETIQTGKWHLGNKEANWPGKRGFKKSFSCPQGAGFYFHIGDTTQGRSITRNDKVVYTKQDDTPEGWYATDAWTDEGLQFVNEAVEADKPFFWYLAYNAPHWPLMAKQKDIAKYANSYTKGWDEIRKARYSRMQELGIIRKEWPMSPRGKSIPAWDKLSAADKAKQANRMAIYAAMIDSVDQNIGKIVKALKALKVFDNTLILFLQDNGACAEGGVLGSDRGKGKKETGGSGSYISYGECWANASNTPFRRYKHWVHEGGAATPLVAHWPAGISKQLNSKLINEPSHLVDIMATCVDISGATYPKIFNDTEIIPMQGKTLTPLFTEKAFERGPAIFWEHEGNRAIRDGKWKLVAIHGGHWELYDMEKDRTELNDLATKMPEKVKGMAAQYEAWGKSAMVEPWGKKKKKGKK